MPNAITGVPDPDNPEKIKLNYFKSIPSHSKIYNKVMMQNQYYKKKLNIHSYTKSQEAAATEGEGGSDVDEDEGDEEPIKSQA